MKKHEEAFAIMTDLRKEVLAKIGELGPQMASNVYGCSPAYMSRILSGIQIPSSDTILLMAEKFDL